MKIFKLLFLFILFPLHITAKEIPLTDGWLLNGKYNATVPSTIMGVLTANGEYPGILEGLSYKDIDRSRFDQSFIYSKEFELTTEDLKENIFLQLDGISYRANIYLNGKLVADKNTIYGAYRRHTLDITKYAQATNKLEIEVFRAQKGEPNAGYVDWNPRPADESMGLFRPVSIHTCGDVLVQNLGVSSQVDTSTLKEAWLQVSADVTNMTDHPIQGKIVGKFDGKTFTYPIALTAREKKTIRLNADMVPDLHVIEPRLWWCRQMGEPELYNMELEFQTNNAITDKAKTSFGIREIGSYYTKEGYRGFTLNGKQVLVRGGGWTDDIFMRDDDMRYETQINYVCDMNMNAIRMENIWGTSQHVFDVCDQKGIMVLPGWTCHWEWEVYLGIHCDEIYGGLLSENDRILMGQYFKDQILWLRNHPSIICWFVGSDKLPTPALEQDYNEILRQIDPTRPLVTSAKKLESTLSGSAGMKMAGPYDYVGPAYWYDKRALGGAIGFNTETGIGAQLPQKESLIRMLGKNPWPISDVWNYHCTASESSMGKLDRLIEVVTGRYGKAENLEDFLHRADLANYESTRAMFEAFRVNEPHTTGIIQWMLNSARPGLYWQLYDHYLVPNASYYSVKKGNEPCQLIYDYNGNIWVVNDTQRTHNMKASMTIYGLDGKILAKDSKMVESQPRVPQKVFKVSEIKGNAFLLLKLETSSNVILNDYVLTDKPDVHDWQKSDWITTPMHTYGDYSKLTTLPMVKPIVKATANRQSELVITIQNTSDIVAFFVRLVLKDKSGELITPLFYSDNYFTMEPNSDKTFTCKLPVSKLPKGCKLSIEGWNVAEQTIKVQ